MVNSRQRHHPHRVIGNFHLLLWRKNDFARIGKMTAKMLRKCRMDHFGENEDRENGGLLDDGEVWLWQHTQRNAAASALAAASLKPDLYEFACSLVGDKAEERRRRVVELLRKKCVESLKKVEQEQVKANSKGVFHHDSNDVRANAHGRLALLKALDLAKCDEVVLKEMVAEKKVSDAEIAAEFAEARSIMAAKERRNWEEKQEETLNEMRIEQLKERALALDIDLPPTTHTLKIQLIGLIIKVFGGGCVRFVLFRFFFVFFFCFCPFFHRCSIVTRVPLFSYLSIKYT
jgi:putative lipoic acid-binding regulatory protein